MDYDNELSVEHLTDLMRKRDMENWSSYCIQKICELAGLFDEYLDTEYGSFAEKKVAIRASMILGFPICDMDCDKCVYSIMEFPNSFDDGYIVGCGCE